DAPTALAPEEEDLRLLTHFAGRLGAIDTEPATLHDAVSGGNFGHAAYRLSLLALLADSQDSAPADGPIGAFMRLPLKVDFDTTLVDVGHDEIARISAGSIRRLRPHTTD
ncbi:MAG: hypothetical protein KDF67_07225, partial [Ottowia sp.]|nr:hypothetical protein [Ottowia sp.]